MKPKKEQRVEMAEGDNEGAAGEVLSVDADAKQATVQFADGSSGTVDFNALRAAKDKP